MKHCVVALLAFIVLASVAGFAGESTKAEVHTLKGYVVDALCAKHMTKKEHPMEEAAAHTRECALMEACVASGYGVISEGKLLTFDAKGSRMAKDLIEKSSRKDHLFVEVKGIVKGKTVSVTTIKEADVPSQ